MPVQFLECRDCGIEFVFDEGEQHHFLTLGFPPPFRCKACRARKRLEVEERQVRRGYQSKSGMPRSTLRDAVFREGTE